MQFTCGLKMVRKSWFMRKIKLPLFLLLVLFGAGVTTLQAADAKPEVKPVAAPSSTPYKVSETAPFITLANAALAALNAGKQTEMVAKLTDLESAWDDKEKELRPRNEAVWVSIDKTLDKGIAALRGSKVNLTKGKAALEALVKELAAASKD